MCLYYLIINMLKYIHVYIDKCVYIYICIKLFYTTHRYIYIYIYIYYHHHHHVMPPTWISLTLSPLHPIVHRFWQILRTTSRILTELLYEGLSWSPCLCSTMWGGLLENITYELVPASPAVSCMFGSSNFDSFHDGR